MRHLDRISALFIESISVRYALISIEFRAQANTGQVLGHSEYFASTHEDSKFI